MFAVRVAVVAISFALLSFLNAASAAPVTWDGDTNSDIYDGGNWVGGAAPLNDDDATFPGGLAIGASVTPTVNVPAMWFKSATFAAGAPQYTYTSTGNSFEFFNPGLNTLINNSTSTQVIHAVGVANGQALMTGYLNAASGDFVINAPIGVGSNSSTSTRYLAVSGANDFFFNVSPTINPLGSLSGGAWTSSVTTSMYAATRGRFFMDTFSGTAYMGDIGTEYVGTFHVNSNANGALRLTHDNALGSQSGLASNTNPGLIIWGGVGGVNPAAGNGTVELDGSAAGGGISTGRKIVFVDGRSGTIADDPHFLNVSGNNTFDVAGDWNTGFAGAGSGFNAGNINLQSDSGKVTFTGGPMYNTRAGAFTLQLMGAADGEIANQVTTYLANPSFALVKRGAGTWTLSNASNNYTGNTTVEQGTLSLGTTGTISGSAVIEVKSGANFDVSGIAGGYTLGSPQTLKGTGTVIGGVNAGFGSIIAPGASVGTLTMSGDVNLNGGTLQYELTNNPAGTNDLITGINNLTLAGSTIHVTPTSGSLGNGTYTLINYSGSLTGDALNNLFLANTPNSPRQTFNLSSATANKIDLIVTGSAGNLTWVGGVNADAWDVGGTVNWTGHPTDNHFYDGDSVTFTNSGTKTPNIVGVVAPGQATFTNTVGQDYTVSGGDLNASGNLVASGTGNVTFTNNNISVGGTFTQSGAGKTTLANTGTITTPNPIAINAGTLAINRPFDETLSNTFSGSAILRKEGTNSLTLSGNSAGFTGTIQVGSGTLKPGGAGALGTSAGATVVETGATLDLNASDTGDETISIVGTGVGGAGALTNASAGFGVVKNLALTGDASINTGGAGMYINIGNGPGSLLQGNGHDLTVLTTSEIDIWDVGDTGLADINISGGGSLYFGGTGTPGSTPGTVNLSNNSGLGFYGSLYVNPSTGAFNKPIAVDVSGGAIFTYQGNKTVDSTITIATGGTLEGTGFPRNNSTTATLTLTGKITGAGNLVVHREGNATSSRRAMVELTSNDNDYSGTTTIGGGGGITGESAAQDYVTLSIGNGGATGSIGPGDITVNALGVLRFNRVATYTIANTITGGGDVSADAAGGVVNLTGNNSYNGVTNVNAGVLNVNGTHTGGVDYTVALGATLGGTGTIGSNVTVNGSLAPGASIETLDIGGNVLLNGALNIEFNGDTDIIDRLNVTGSFDITTATVSFANLGTASLSGVPHIFATYGSLVGTAFTSVTGLPGGYAIDYAYLGNQIALVAGAHPGDFDLDGDVDGADFVAWQTNFPTATGATLADGDADGDGDVDGADFVVWQTNFPFTPGPGASPVPEPQAFILLSIASALALMRLRSQRKQ